MFRRRSGVILSLIGVIVLLWVFPGAALSEWVPKQPVKMIVPWPAGGGTDLYARIVVPHWEKYLPGDQPIVIVNKTGGGGVIGTAEVFNAKPDGYTIGLTIPNAMILNQLTASVPFDMRKFEILGGPSLYTRTLYSNPKSLPDVKTWKDVLEKIYKLRFATYGFGATAHLAPLVVGYVSKLFDPAKLNFVHYKGTAGVVAGFQRGDAEVYFGAVEAHGKYAEQGLMRTILILDDERNKIIPDIPTSVEAGIPGAREINAAFYDPKAFIAPPGTPKDIVDTYVDSLMKAMKDPACAADAQKAKSPLEAIPPEKLRKFIPQAIETWSQQKEVLKLIKGGS